MRVRQSNCINTLPPPDYCRAGKTNWKPALKLLVDEAHISGRISWAGMIDGDLKWGAFHAAEAIISPSYQEYFGIEVVEAMDCETPA